MVSLYLQAYVSFISQLGAAWFERNQSAIIRHLLVDVAATVGRSANQSASAAATSTSLLSAGYLETVYVRRCVLHVLDATVGRLLNEKAQTDACKEYGVIVAECMNAIGE